MTEKTLSLSKPVAWLSFENDKLSKYNSSIVVLNETFESIVIKWEDLVAETLNANQHQPIDSSWPSKLRKMADQLETVDNERKRKQTKQKVYKAVHKNTGKVYQSKRTGKTVWTNKGHLKSSMAQRKITQSDYFIQTYLLDMTDAHNLASD